MHGRKDRIKNKVLGDQGGTAMPVESAIVKNMEILLRRDMMGPAMMMRAAVHSHGGMPDVVLGMRRSRYRRLTDHDNQYQQGIHQFPHQHA
jgi:hypothetical protein